MIELLIILTVFATNVDTIKASLEQVKHLWFDTGNNEDV
jgi:hypothetical protein